MSGVESVHIIVEAEKEAAKILQDAHARASEIRKTLDSVIEERREETLRTAKREATALIQSAEHEASTEAETYERSTLQAIGQAISDASSKKGAAVEKLVMIILEQR
jgi:vacuolar-type H+-ATPase subunit E/Vma4